MGFFELNEKHTQFVGDAVIVDLPGDKKCAIELAQGPDGLIYYTNLTGMYRLEPIAVE
jgi:hypothetical protein